jgi:EmrB/QacA subfamily drug resistance transporter
VATLASFLTPFMGSSINVALPAIGRDFGLDAVTLSWVPTSFLLAAAVCLVPFGKGGDIHGRKRVFTWGLLVYAATSLLCALAPSASWLIGARVAQGVGGAMIFGTSVAILSSVIPAQRRGAALGVNVAAVYLGLSLGPFLGGLLTDRLGWRRIFELNAVLGLLTASIVVARLPGEWAAAKGARLDLAGSGLYALGLAAIMYGLSRLPTASGAELIVAGLGAMAAFVWWELRSESPVLEIALFRDNRVFALSNLAALINYGATFAVGFLLSLYLQYAKGLTAQAAGVVLVAQPIVQALVSPFAGRLSDRVESRIVASSGMGLIVAGLALLALLSEGTPLGHVVACLVLLGFGFGLFSSPNTNAVMGAVAMPFYGVASATLATMRLVGQMLSMGIAMLILGLYLGPRTITPARHAALLEGTRTAFGAFAALCVLGTLASLARGGRAPCEPMASGSNAATPPLA